MHREPRTRVFSTVLVFFLAGFVEAAPPRFDPEVHFPKETMYYASANIGKLRQVFGETPLGAMAVHPGVRRALGSLPDMLLNQIRRETSDFEKELGVDLFEFLDLFTGEAAVTIPSADNREGPRMLIAVELGTGSRKKKALDVVKRMGELATSRRGSISSETIQGQEVTRWDVRYDPTMWHLVLGTHLLFTVGESPAGVIERYKGGDGGGSLRSNRLFRRARKATSGFDPLVTIFLNIEHTRKQMLEAFRDIPPEWSPEAEVRAFLEMSGLDKASSAIYQMGFHDGDWEGKLFLDSPEGLSGFLELFAETVSGPQNLAPLGRIPAEASTVWCFSIHAGRLLRGIVEGSRKGFPEGAGEIDAAVKAFETVSGLSVSSDVYGLPRLNCYGFQVFPPAGGMLPDSIVLCKMGEVLPYLNLLDKLARKAGVEPKRIEVKGGRTVAYLRVGGLVRQLTGVSADSMRAFAARELLLFDPAFSFSFAQLDDEWLVIASTPQAIERYIESYAGAKKLTDLPEILGLVENKIGSGSPFTLMRGGKGFLPTYNSVVSLLNLAAPHLEPILKQYGVEPAALPPAERFADRFQDGFLVMKATSDSLLLHGHRVLTNAIGGSIPEAFAILGAMGFKSQGMARMESQSELGASRLEELGQILGKYPEASGTRAYPYDPAGSLASFQRLADQDLLPDPSVLVHPLSSDLPARPGTDGKPRLEERNVSYVLVAWKQGPKDSSSRLLCYEKRPYTGGGRYVLFVDLSVKFLPESEFQELLRAQTERYGKKTGK